MSEVHEGGCLCRAVRYHVKGNSPQATVCHCTFCQRRTGSGFAIVVSISEENVELTGDGLTTYEYRSDESNHWLRLHFCIRCGTTVMVTAENRPGICTITVGTLDDPNWVKIERHVWTRSAQHWMVFPQNVDRFEKSRSHTVTQR